MKKEYILFIDSGIGGLSTLAVTFKLYNFNYIYFADNKNCPYGEKLNYEINSYIKNILSEMTNKYNIIAVVLACNTATAVAINNLRKQLKIPIIGSEPAVYYAHKMGYNKILSLTTPTTKKQNKYKNLCNTCDCEIKTLSLKNFVPAIEEYFLSGSLYSKIKLLKIISKIVVISKNYDCIVLGCTHYCLTENYFKIFTDMPIISGNRGIANNITSKIKIRQILQNQKNNVNFVFSKQGYGLEKKYIKILSQTLAKL